MNEIIIFLLLLALSAVFSGTETAVTNVNEYNFSGNDIKPEKKKHLINMTKDKSSYIAALLVGNNIVNTVLAVYAGVVADDILERYGLDPSAGPVVASVVSIVFLLIFGEILPKQFGVAFSKTWCNTLITPLRFLVFILKPITITMNWLSKTVMSWLPVKKNDDAPSVTEIMAMAENSVKAGKIDSMEKSLMYSSSQINDLKAEDVMIPKNKIVAVKSNVSVSELLRIFKTHLYSRIPVYSTTIDEIIGIFNIKECLKLKPEEEENFDIRNYMIKPIYVPGNVTIGSLMEQMKSTRIHMAVVVSEYGITDGIVTLENILERIIGLIGDEYDDESEDMLITMNNKGTKELEVDGTISLQDLSKELSIDIPSAKHKVNTLNGYITEEKGDFVAVGEEFIIENYIFKVLSIKGRCADKIRITKKNG